MEQVRKEVVGGGTRLKKGAGGEGEGKEGEKEGRTG